MNGRDNRIEQYEADEKQGCAVEFNKAQRARNKLKRVKDVWSYESGGRREKI